MSTISIALCTFNGEQFLQDQLDSYVAQRRKPDELVVCDDRSTDETLDMLERFAATAPFAVRILVNDSRLGSTRNFERAISLCSGDLIFLSDQDDVWLPQKLGRFEEEFEKRKEVGLVFSDAEVVDEDLHSLGRRLLSLTSPKGVHDDLRGGRAFESLLDQNFVTGATAAFRSGFRERLSPTPDGVPNLIHDAWIALSIANEAPIAFIDEPLIKYRQHGRQQIGLRVGREGNRREYFDKTINTLGDEARRLEMLKVIFATRPQFRSFESIDKLIDDKRDYFKHCEVRRDLPRSRAARLLPVVRELMTGRYGKFSRGALSAAKDIVEKVDAESDR